MIEVPNDKIHYIIEIINWHLRTYVPQKEMDIRLERILDKLYKSSAHYTLDEAEAYWVMECISEATNNVEEIEMSSSDKTHPLHKDIIWDLYDWLTKSRKN